MKQKTLKSVIFALGFLWVILTGSLGAPWPVVVMPVLLLLWVAPYNPPSPIPSDIAAKINLTGENVAELVATVRAIDEELQEHRRYLVELVDRELLAMRESRKDPPSS